MLSINTSKSYGTIDLSTVHSRGFISQKLPCMFTWEPTILLLGLVLIYSRVVKNGNLRLKG